MDGLIALIVIVAIFNALTSSGRKKRRERTRAQADTRDAQPQTTHREQRSSTLDGRARVPYTREEWANYMRDIDPTKVGQGSDANPGRGHAAPSSREDLKPAEPKVVAPASMGTPGEGSVSTQGESDAEHAEHLHRAAARDAAQRSTSEALFDPRAVRRDSLRAAIVLRELLDKPLALRPRTGYHR